MERLASPRITERIWGRIDIDGCGSFKDAKLFPGGAREWDWSETGTRHVPGVQVADAEELVARGITHLVLSTGVHERLQVSAATVEAIEARGVVVIVAPTPQAVERYNALTEKYAVAALIHSTC